ncbi:hypothetical protein C2G38_2234845, partial [Gigaspora rosea]
MSSNPGLNYKEIGFISISIQVGDKIVAKNVAVNKNDSFKQIRDRFKIYNEKDCDLVITNCMVFTGKNGLPIPQDKEEELKLENFEDYDILKILDNKSSNFTEFLKGKSIEIQVDSKSMTTFKKFTKENSLSDIRNEFKKNHGNDILIEDFMVFMKDKSQIPPDEESNVKLEQFMDSGTIVIKVESLKELPKCNHLIKKFYLKHGLKKMNDSIEILKKAIKFHCKTKEETKKGKCRCIKTYTKIEVHSKGIETSTDTSHKKLIAITGNAEIPHPFFAEKFAISYKRANEIIKQIDNSHEYNEIIFKKAELKLHKPKLAHDLLNEVRKILTFDDEVEKLKLIKIKNSEDKELNKYLQDLKGSSLDESYKEEIRNFINNSKEVLKNNSLKNLENLEKRVKEELHKIYEEFASITNNAGNFGEVTAQTSNKDEEKKREVVKDIGFEVVGESKDQDDITSWITSLSDWKNWEIVGYEDEPIFNLLDNHQRDRIIKKIVGKRILKKGLIHINENEYQIFAFVVDKKRKSEIYSIRVVYKNDDHKLLIHCIEGNKNEFDLHVGWIIVGYPKTFDVEEPEFKCSEHIKETDTIQVDLDDFPLIT